MVEQTGGWSKGEEFVVDGAEEEVVVAGWKGVSATGGEAPGA